MKLSKKLAALLLSIALLVTLFPQASAQAATKTQKETLLVGEVVNYTPLLGTLKSVSSSKKAVATVKKKDGKAVVTAKKAGRATITIKSTKGTNKIVITVKKLSFTCGLKVIPGYVLISVKNNSSVFMDSATVAYSFKNPEGETVRESTCIVNDLMPNKTAYYKVSYADHNLAVSTTNSSVAVADHSRSLSAKYKSRISATKVTVTEEDKENQKLTCKIQNTYSGSVTGGIDFLFYDADGKIVYYTYKSVYLKGKEVTTDTVSAYAPDGYASYKMVPRTYSKTY